MSRSAKSQFKSASKLRDRYIEREALAEIRDFLEGCILDNPWDLSQEEAEKIRDNWQKHEILMSQLRAKGKSPGARYIAARINSGADPDLHQLTRDWFAHRNIRRSVIFVVREHGLLTHCVEVCGDYINQFYRSGNNSPDSGIRNSVSEALRQARLLP